MNHRRRTENRRSLAYSWLGYTREGTFFPPSKIKPRYNQPTTSGGTAMPQSTKDAPNVIAIPPLIHLAFLAVGLLLDYLFPVPVLPNSIQYAVGFGIIIATGLVMPFGSSGFLVGE